MSADGRFVMFSSNSASLSDIDVDGSSNVFVRDLLLDRTELASRATGPSGAAATDASSGAISADGRKVAFSASDLSADSPAGVTQVYLRDLDAQTTTLVSRGTGAAGAPATIFAGAPDISADGRRVVFVTRSGLDPAANDGFQHVYVRDLDTQTTVLADRADGANGAIAPVFAQEPAISGNGRRVTWDSKAAYAGAPADGYFHAFVRDIEANTTTLMSRADGAAGASAAADTRSPTLNGDGTIGAFSTRAQNLGETFINPQVFVRDLARGQTIVVSRATGTGPLSASADAPDLDASGARVAFYASGSLTPDVPPGSEQQIYTRDVLTGQTTLVSRAAGLSGVRGDGESVFPAISSTGDCVAFQSRSTNLDSAFGSADFPAVYLRVLRGECPPPAPPAPPAPGPPPPSDQGTGGGARRHAVSDTPGLHPGRIRP